MQPANLHTLTQVRSSKVAAVLAYLQQVADEAAKLPAYFPDHLKTPNTGEILPFDSIRQQLKVIEDRSELHQRLARINEQRRASGQDDQIYAPRRYNGLEEEHQQKTVTFSWDHKALNRHQRMAILGDPGYGKSWLLRYEARRSAIEQIKKMAEHQLTMEALVLPVCLPLASIANYLPDDTKTIEHRTIENALAYHVQTRAPKIHEHEQTYDLTALFKEKLLSWNCLLLLDAWDEVADEKRDVLFKGLVEFFESYRKPKVLLTSRIVGYFNQTRLAGFQEAELLGFDPKHSRAVARLWFKGQESALEQFEVATRQQSGIRHLLRIPLLLTLALRAHQSHYSFPDKVSVQPDFFPTRRVELYSHCLNALAIDWQEEKNHLPENELKVKKLLRKTALAAFKLTERQRESFSKLEFVQALGENDTDEVIDFIDSLLKIGILVRIGDHSSAPMIFLHRTFQEYLTALHLSNLANQQGWASIEAIVEQWSWQPEKDVILELLAGLLVDPAPILDHLADDKTDGYFRGRLNLAARCMGEIDETKLETLGDKVSQICDQVLEWFEEDWSSKYVNKEGIGHMVNPSFLTTGLTHLGRIGTGNCSERVTHYLNQSGQFMLLADVGTDSAVSVLLGNVQSDESHIRKATVHALRLTGSDQAHEALLRMLGDSNPDVRLAAALCLGLFGSDRAVEALLGMLGDDDYMMRWTAAEALGRIGSEQGVDALLGLLKDGDPMVGLAAEEALKRIGTDPALDGLLRFLEDDNSWKRIVSVNALGRIGKDQALKGLLQFLRDDDIEVRIETARALGHVGTDPAVEALLQMLVDTDPDVRLATADSLGQIGSDRAVEVLLSLLEDNDYMMRWTAADALREIGSEQTVSPLLRLMGSADPDVRKSAISALGQVGLERAVEPLLRILWDADPEVRKSAISALGRVGSERVVESLIRMLGDTDSSVIWNALSIIEENFNTETTRRYQRKGFGRLWHWFARMLHKIIEKFSFFCHKKKRPGNLQK